MAEPITVFGKLAYPLEHEGTLHAYICTDPWIQIWHVDGFWYAASYDVSPPDPRGSAQDACLLLEQETRKFIEKWNTFIENKNKSNDLFEAHITYNGEHRWMIESYCPQGWKFSAITGDPILGKETYCYLTSYDVDCISLLQRMQQVVYDLGITVVRQKIEKIIYDTKIDRDEINI